MELTEHAKPRAAQRGFSEDEINVLSAISLNVEQKGGASLCTIYNKERSRWGSALKEVLGLLRKSNQLPRKFVKRKMKVVKRLIEKLSAKHLPYLVVSDLNENVITCGHYYNRKIKRA